MQATGPMSVQLQPQVSPGGYARLTLTKQYAGPLQASAVGEMLSGGDPKLGNAGYVALETVTGTLDGRAGTFQIMQAGTLIHGTPELRCLIVPGSGTGALETLNGTMELERTADGQHTYTLAYTLAEPTSVA